MVGFPWLPSLTLGIKRLDEDHRHLLALLTELAGYVEASDAVRARPAVEDFLSAVERHFAYEERLMRDAGYPETARHAACHAESRALMGRLRDTILAGASSAAAPLLQDLGGRYFRNLLHEDGAMAEWLLARGMVEEGRS